MDNRRFPRYSVALKAEAKNSNRESSFGVVKDFSRQGTKVIFDQFDFEPNSSVELKIQRPHKDVYIPAMGQVMWKKLVEGKWEAGIKLLDFPPEVKVEILEHGYHSWLNTCGIPRVS